METQQGWPMLSNVACRSTQMEAFCSPIWNFRTM